MTITVVHQNDPISDTVAGAGCSLLPYHGDVYVVRAGSVYRIWGLGDLTSCGATLTFHNDRVGGLFVHEDRLYASASSAAGTVIYEIRP